MSHRMSAEDRLDIFDLFARYTWAYDCGDAAAYAQTFTEDGVLSDQGTLRAVGRAAIREAVKHFFGTRGQNVWQHYNDHLRILGDEQQCTVYSYYAVLERRHTDGLCHVLSLGYYRNLCIKIGGEWLLKERQFFVDLPPKLPWAESQGASGHTTPGHE